MIHSNKKALTLVELLVVVSIIGLLSMLAMINYRNYRALSHLSKAKIYYNEFRTAMEDFMMYQGYYPLCQIGMNSFSLNDCSALTKYFSAKKGMSIYTPANSAEGTYGFVCSVDYADSADSRTGACCDFTGSVGTGLSQIKDIAGAGYGNGCFVGSRGESWGFYP